MRDCDERMKGGAVREERSPLKEAIDCCGLLEADDDVVAK